mgnify:CR=1 FL=1
MLINVVPEDVGISSEKVLNYLKLLNEPSCWQRKLIVTGRKRQINYSFYYSLGMRTNKAHLVGMLYSVIIL